MRLKRVIFRESCEAPGTNSKVVYLQSTEPLRKDSYVSDLRLASFGVLAGDEVYPLHMVRRMTVDAQETEVEQVSDLKALAAHEADHLVDLPSASKLPKKRGRPAKA